MNFDKFSKVTPSDIDQLNRLTEEQLAMLAYTNGNLSCEDMADFISRESDNAVVKAMGIGSKSQQAEFYRLMDSQGIKTIGAVEAALRSRTFLIEEIEGWVASGAISRGNEFEAIKIGYPEFADKMQQQRDEKFERETIERANDVDHMVDKVQKYLSGKPSGYFHHGTLIMDTEKAYKKEKRDIVELDVLIPNWRTELEKVTNRKP